MLQFSLSQLFGVNAKICNHPERLFEAHAVSNETDALPQIDRSFIFKGLAVAEVLNLLHETFWIIAANYSNVDPSGFIVWLDSNLNSLPIIDFID